MKRAHLQRASRRRDRLNTKLRGGAEGCRRRSAHAEQEHNGTRQQRHRSLAPARRQRKGASASAQRWPVVSAIRGTAALPGGAPGACEAGTTTRALADVALCTSATRIGAAMAVATPRWAQVQITLPPAKRGCHLITQRVAAACAQEMKHIEIGLAHVFSACLRCVRR